LSSSSFFCRTLRTFVFRYFAHIGGAHWSYSQDSFLKQNVCVSLQGPRVVVHFLLVFHKCGTTLQHSYENGARRSSHVTETITSQMRDRCCWTIGIVGETNELSEERNKSVVCFIFFNGHDLSFFCWPGDR
jgi:hypothetical protein